MKRTKRAFRISSLLLVFVVFLSGCTVAFRGELTSEETFYLQAFDGSVTETEVSNSDNLEVEVDPNTTVGGYIQTPSGDTSVYWVPMYTNGLDGIMYYDMDTETGLPTKIPESATVQNILINPMDPNQVLVSIDVLDQDGQSVDGFTHVFVSETSSENGIKFFDFDYVNGSDFGGIPPLAVEEEPIVVDPMNVPADSPVWRTGDSTSTIFGYYNLNASFFNKLAVSLEIPMQTTLHPLLDNLGENTESPEDGVTAILSLINGNAWEKGSFSLDLKTGTTDFATAVNVPLPELTATTPATGTVQLSWPAVFGEATGYRIFQDGEPIGEVGSDVTTYEVTGLTVGQTYEFSVKGILEIDDELVDSVLELSATQTVVDVQAPVVTLIGDNPIIIGHGSEFVDPGAKATDDVDGDLTDKVAVTGTVDTNTPGEYTLVYSVTDNAGNKGQASRIVRVVDQDAPVITLKGDNPLTIEQGSQFTDPGVTATDVVDGDLTDKVTITGEVDSDTPGEYKLVYQVTDSAGNKTEVTRLVKVIEKKTAPTTEVEKDKGTKGGGSLPKTATSHFNWLLIGSVLGLAGVLLLVGLKRRVRA
ncbi:immunoglobulin-like domain-containing protein [Fredinandcohnia sp. 179-A 10B2 NHS]|uniref:immunoglobulin-like domain-containing protein n=1 Tax=Fredinandcohnia sp. 179-A 10B2 NHS TaxID=3235176 RepID=UPI0039A0E58D